jgi:hypothetical protein
LTYNAGSTDPKISAFEDTDGKFISIVMFTPPTSTNNGNIGNGFGTGGLSGNDDPTRGSTDVGRIEVVLPDGFTATSASAIRSYGDKLSTGQTWDDQPTGKPRFWINEPVFILQNADGRSAVEVTLPGGNIISIKVSGSWDTAKSAGRHFEARVRPFNEAKAAEILNKSQNKHNLTTSTY